MSQDAVPNIRMNVAKTLEIVGKFVKERKMRDTLNRLR